MAIFPVDPSYDVSEMQLARHFREGEKEAFEELVRRYSPSLFNFIYHFLRNYDQACDTLQTVFIRFYIAFPTIDITRPLKPWLFQVAHNSCIDEIRKRKSNLVFFTQIEQESDEGGEGGGLYDIPDDAPSSAEIVEQHELARFLRDAIAQLPPAYRSIVLLRYVSQLHFKEIAAVMNIPEATVKTYFHRAKSKLRVLLQASGIYGKDYKVGT